MKLQVISDLHLEHMDNPVLANMGSDVLILSGDICVAQHLYRHPRGTLPNNAENGERAARYREFFDHVNANWAQVIYVMGNHEHYSGRWDRTLDVLREEISHYSHIHLCDQDRVVIDDTVFLGVSLWTDFNGGDRIDMLSMPDLMNDYRAITEKQTRNGTEVYHNLRPQTTYEKHKSDLDWLRVQLSLDQRKTVVVGHHCPSHASIHHTYQQPRYRTMNGAFVSNLDEFILDHPQIALWTHGHTHHCFDYQLGDTRIVCNPLGYPGERSGFDPDLVIDIG